MGTLTPADANKLRDALLGGQNQDPYATDVELAQTHADAVRRSEQIGSGDPARWDEQFGNWAGGMADILGLGRFGQQAISDKARDAASLVTWPHDAGVDARQGVQRIGHGDSGGYGQLAGAGMTMGLGMLPLPYGRMMGPGLRSVTHEIPKVAPPDGVSVGIVRSPFTQNSGHEAGTYPYDFHVYRDGQKIGNIDSSWYKNRPTELNVEWAGLDGQKISQDLGNQHNLTSREIRSVMAQMRGYLPDEVTHLTGSRSSGAHAISGKYEQTIKIPKAVPAPRRGTVVDPETGQLIYSAPPIAAGIGSGMYGGFGSDDASAEPVPNPTKDNFSTTRAIGLGTMADDQHPGDDTPFGKLARALKQR